MDLFTLHNCYISCALNYCKSLLESIGRLHIPKFSGSHCISNEELVIIVKIKDQIHDYYIP